MLCLNKGQGWLGVFSIKFNSIFLNNISGNNLTFYVIAKSGKLTQSNSALILPIYFGFSIIWFPLIMADISTNPPIYLFPLDKDTIQGCDWAEIGGWIGVVGLVTYIGSIWVYLYGGIIWYVFGCFGIFELN